MGKKARRIAAGGASLAAAGALTAAITHEGGSHKVPVNDPSAKVTFRLGHMPGQPALLGKLDKKKDGEMVITPVRERGTAIDIYETRQGGLRAQTQFSGNPMSMDVELPMPGPNEVNPDLTPDGSEPSIQYTPRSKRGPFHNTTIIDGQIVPYRGHEQGEPVIIQEDGHGGLIAKNAAGQLLQVTVHLPTPDANGQYEPLHPNHP